MTKWRSPMSKILFFLRNWPKYYWYVFCFSYILMILLLNRITENRINNLFNEMDYTLRVSTDHFIEKDNVFKLKLNVAGIKKQNIKTYIKNDILLVRAEQDGKTISFNRPIPCDADQSTGSVRLEDGILTISFERRKEKQEKELKIN